MVQKKDVRMDTGLEQWKDQSLVRNLVRWKVAKMANRKVFLKEFLLGLRVVEKRELKLEW